MAETLALCAREPEFKFSRYSSKWMSGQNTKWTHGRSPSHFMSYSLIFLSLDQPDELREPFFREQLRHKPYLLSSYKTYGKNTARCFQERSQRLLLTTHETTDCWEISLTRNEVKYSFPGWLFYLCSFKHNRFVPVSYARPMFSQTFKAPFTASLTCKSATWILFLNT